MEKTTNKRFLILCIFSFGTMSLKSEQFINRVMLRCRCQTRCGRTFDTRSRDGGEGRPPHSTTQYRLTTLHLWMSWRITQAACQISVSVRIDHELKSRLTCRLKGCLSKSWETGWQPGKLTGRLVEDVVSCFRLNGILLADQPMRL